MGGSSGSELAGDGSEGGSKTGRLSLANTNQVTSVPVAFYLLQFVIDRFFFY